MWISPVIRATLLNQAAAGMSEGAHVRMEILGQDVLRCLWGDLEGCCALEGCYYVIYIPILCSIVQWNQLPWTWLKSWYFLHVLYLWTWLHTQYTLYLEPTQPSISPLIHIRDSPWHHPVMTAPKKIPTILYSDWRGLGPKITYVHCWSQAWIMGPA